MVFLEEAHDLGSSLRLVGAGVLAARSRTLVPAGFAFRSR
jgi:hypothetical protein